MKWLTLKGYGCETKQSNAISGDQGNSLWETGAFNLETASGILNIFFFSTIVNSLDYAQRTNITI